MNQRDLFTTAFHNLAVRKLRTTLNLVGIIVSCVLLLCTLAATTGVGVALEDFIKQSESALRIRLFPDYDRTIPVPEEVTKVDGEMDERRRNRIKKELARAWREEKQVRSHFITSENLDTIRQLEGVNDLVPMFRTRCAIKFNGKKIRFGKYDDVISGSVSYQDNNLAGRVLHGQMLSRERPQELLIHEFLAYRLGFQSDGELDQLIGQTITIQFRGAQATGIFDDRFTDLDFENQVRILGAVRKILTEGIDSLDEKTRKLIESFVQTQSKKETDDSKSLPNENSQNSPTENDEAVVEKTYKIAGVFRNRDDNDPIGFLFSYIGENPPILMHYSELKPFYPAETRGGVSSAEVFVDGFARIDTVTKTARDNSMQAVSVANHIERVHDGINQAKYTIFAIVLIVLLISAVGITNTMIMSLIERTEEIGIMKAIGASNRSVMWMILYEGVLTGVVGGLASVLIGYLIAFAGNWVLLSYVEFRTQVDLETQLFTIQPWMIGITILVSITVTTLAGVWPAFRAARLDPVVAMNR